MTCRMQNYKYNIFLIQNYINVIVIVKIWNNLKVKEIGNKKMFFFLFFNVKKRYSTNQDCSGYDLYFKTLRWYSIIKSRILI